MTGVLWAAVAGIGFGLFQTANRAAMQDMDVYRSTFIQLLVSAAILAGASAATEDLSRLWSMPPGAAVDFSLAGIIHFLVGWTLLNVSQKRLGAARTSPLLATTPLFGAVIAAVTLGEIPNVMATVGIVLIVLGVYALSLERVLRPAAVASSGSHAPVTVDGPAEAPGEGFTWRASLFGMGAALCWAISPLFIRNGLDGLDSPLLGVTISLVASVVAYGVLLMLRGHRTGPAASRPAMAWKLSAGVLVGLSTWARWVALDLAPVAVVLGLGLLSVPTVILLAPLLMGRHIERVTPPVLAGAALVVAGSLVLIVRP